jgi:phenylalanyl-tRNA synthetase beta chain
MTERGVRRGIECMRQWAGGTVAQGLADTYPLPAPTVVVDLPIAEVTRLMGVGLPVEEIVRILKALEFGVETRGEAETLRVTAPDHRLDIGTGVIGQADLIEEIARIYGYENIPETQLADRLPPQRGNPALELEERTRDLLVQAGLQEVVTYSLTAPQRERRVLPASAPADDQPYVTLANPIVSDRVVMRHTVLAGVLDIAAANLRHHDRLGLFEIGPVYLQGENDEHLPDEKRRLVIVLTGPREPLAWQGADRTPMDFFDLKGAVESVLSGLPVKGVSYAPPEPEAQHPTYLPGRTARLLVDGQPAGWLGEVHPVVRQQFDLPEQAVLAADLDLDRLLEKVNPRYAVVPVPEYPPVKEDLAVIVNDDVPGAVVEAAIRAAGGNLLVEVTLFDRYRGAQVGPGKKSLAYRLTYQAPDRTLTDAEATKLRGKIIKRLTDELGAVIRS